MWEFKKLLAKYHNLEIDTIQTLKNIKRFNVSMENKNDTHELEKVDDDFNIPL